MYLGFDRSRRIKDSRYGFHKLFTIKKFGGKDSFYVLIKPIITKRIGVTASNLMWLGG
jgi:hypothetical protein